MNSVTLYKIKHEVGNSIYHYYHFRTCKHANDYVQNSPNSVSTKKFSVNSEFRKRKLTRVLEKRMLCGICSESFEHKALIALLRT